MNELMATVVGWTLRVVVVLAGLVFFASLLVVAAIGALILGVFVGVGSVIGNAFGRAALNGFVGLMRNLPKRMLDRIIGKRLGLLPKE